MKILVLHIPKTGGTAIAKYFMEFFNGNGFGCTHSEEVKNQFKFYKKNIIQQYNLIQGHFPLSELINDIDCFDFVLAVVREPFSRLISHCNYTNNHNFGSFLNEYYLTNICTRNEQCGYAGIINTFSSVLDSLSKHKNLVLFSYDKLEVGFAEFCSRNKLGPGILPRVNESKYKIASHANIGINRSDVEKACHWFSDDFLLHSFLLNCSKNYVDGSNIANILQGALKKSNTLSIV